MRFDPERASIRFGCGLSSSLPPPSSVDEMMGWLSGPDDAAQSFEIPGMDAAFDLLLAIRQTRKRIKAAETPSDQEQAQADLKELRADRRQQLALWLGNTMLRRTFSLDGFRERLVAFWTDHFTATGKAAPIRFAQAVYTEDAIRPHVSGRFADMLRAAVTHPLMLNYLDQFRSAGPNSSFAKSRKRKVGLNENLAREIIELHTLGVGASYTQTDVRQFAELLTGLSYTPKSGFEFRPDMAEPGTEQVLGVTYGHEGASLEAIYAALDDLAAHPATAAHLARKLAVHFVGDHPDPSLIETMRKRYQDSNGDLMAVYEAMLRHPAAWATDLRNIKRPIDFVGSSLRALDLRIEHIPRDTFPRMNQIFLAPMILMGQSWTQAPAPDGWPEADEDWITPQRLAARVQWAMTGPVRLRKTLPDPREFAEIALGSTLTEQVRFAAAAAETRPEGVGLVLASPAFQRM